MLGSTHPRSPRNGTTAAGQRLRGTRSQAGIVWMPTSGQSHAFAKSMQLLAGSQHWNDRCKQQWCHHITHDELARNVPIANVERVHVLCLFHILRK